MSSPPSDTKQPLPPNREYPRLPPELVGEVLQYHCSFVDLLASSLVCATWNGEARKLFSGDNFSELLCDNQMTAADISRVAELLTEALQYGLHYHTLIKKMEIRTFSVETESRQALEGYAAILATCPPNLTHIIVRGGLSYVDMHPFFDRIKNLTLPAITCIAIYVPLTFHSAADFHTVASFISSQSATLRMFHFGAMHIEGHMTSALRLCTQLRVLSICPIEDNVLLSLIPSLPELRRLRCSLKYTNSGATTIVDELRKSCPYMKDFWYSQISGWRRSWIIVNVHERSPRAELMESDDLAGSNIGLIDCY